MLYRFEGNEEEMITFKVLPLACNIPILDLAIHDHTTSGIQMEDSGSLQTGFTEAQVIRILAEKGISIIASEVQGLCEETKSLRGAARNRPICRETDW